MPPKFIYFDLGNVLLNFDHLLASRQIGALVGLSGERVYEMLFNNELQRQYECGEISAREFFEAFCTRSGTQPDYNAFCHAASDIFEINAGTKAVVAQLARSGRRIGLLSNTCAAHWDFYASGRFTLIPEAFEVVALSFRIGAMKPDPAIFHAAADLADVEPQEIFYTDDIAANVEAAQSVGFDAVQFITSSQLATSLRERGVSFNF